MVRAHEWSRNVGHFLTRLSVPRRLGECHFLLTRDLILRAPPSAPLHALWFIMPHPSEILESKISNFNRVAATAGGFLSVFGLVSYLLKEKFYLEACKLTVLTVRAHGSLRCHGSLGQSQLLR